jgi:hypothetical protein
MLDGAMIRSGENQRARVIQCPGFTVNNRQFADAVKQYGSDVRATKTASITTEKSDSEASFIRPPKGRGGDAVAHH